MLACRGSCRTLPSEPQKRYETPACEHGLPTSGCLRLPGRCNVTVVLTPLHHRTSPLAPGAFRSFPTHGLPWIPRPVLSAQQQKFIEGLASDMQSIEAAPPDVASMRRTFTLERILSGAEADLTGLLRGAGAAGAAGAGAAGGGDGGEGDAAGGKGRAGKAEVGRGFGRSISMGQHTAGLIGF